jgi:Xaa-Pro aminopeptidase
MTVAKLKSYVSGRIKHLRAALKEQSLDALIITDPVDVTYLTGFGGEDSVLIVTATRKVLVTDTRFIVQIKHECPGLPMHIRKGKITDAVGEAIRRLKKSPRKKMALGIEADHVTVSQLRAYRKNIGKGLKQVKNMVVPLRQRKDDYELTQIRKAVRVAQDAMRAQLKFLRVGMSERELAARLEYEMALRGSTEPSFNSIVAVGAHAAQPHAIPGNLRLRKNQSVLYDWGATINGYRSDLTRCYVSGKIRPVFADAYRWVLEAQLAAIEEIRAGTDLKEVDAAAREVLSRSPYPVYGHGTGHGIGLKVHEEPFMSTLSKGTLEEGMVVTVEPGVYLPGKFGIRIEDDVLVTAKGARILSNLDKRLSSVAI